MPGPRSKRKRNTEASSSSSTAPSVRRAGKQRAAATEETGEKNEAGSKAPRTATPAGASKQPSNTAQKTVTMKEATKSDQAPGTASQGVSSTTDPSAAPNAVSTDTSKETPTPSKSTESREALIRGLLSHRKLLLNRVRQTRTAAKEQLEILVKAKPSLATMTDEQEVAHYKETTKEAGSLARKAARMESEAAVSAGEKRTSVSLRRGSGVGKRMNAALSSLAPGSGIAAMVEDVLPSQSLPLPPAPKAPPAPATARASAPAAMPQLKSTSATVARAQAMPPPAAALKAPPPVGSPGRPMQQPTLKSTSLSTSGRGTSTSAALKASQKAALHAGMSSTAPSLPPNALVKHHPSVICREARELRERRNSIRGRLVSLINDRQDRIERAGRTASRAATAGETAAKSEREFGLSGPGKPSHFPRRRRTHWDYLLEEMRWTATDFMEERKWKASTARILGEAIILPTTSTSETGVSTQQQADSSTGDDVVMAEGATAKAGRKRKDVETDGNDEQGPSSAAESNGEQTLRSYDAVSTEDAESAKQLAKVLSRRIAELTDKLIDGAGATSAKDGSVKVREAPTDSEKPASQTSSTEAKTASKDDNGDQHHDPSKDENDEPMDAVERHKAFDRITSSVEALIAKADKTEAKSKKAGASSTKLQGLDLTLSSDQALMADFVEDRWSNVDSGVVLKGPMSSGKTVVACSLLWKHRSGGPQMVVCSSSSMVRWMYELGRFEGLRIHLMSSAGGASRHGLTTTSKSSFEAGDVLLCELSAVTNVSKQEFRSLHSLVVDCRFPQGFRGSRTTMSPEQLESSKLPKVMDVPDELRSVKWWELITASSLRGVNRLLLDCVGPDDNVQSLTGLRDRQVLDIIALRVAFLCGAAIFRMPGQSIQKAVLAWARKRIKILKSSGTKFERVKKVLLSIAAHFYFKAQEVKLLDGESSGQSLFVVRKCSMGATQRAAYDRACVEVRAALATELEGGGRQEVYHSDHYRDVSDALHRLRCQCVHEDMRKELSAPAVCARLGVPPLSSVQEVGHSGFSSFLRKPEDSPSQPDIDLATRIVRGSCKLQQLVKILCDDCEFESVVADRLRHVLQLVDDKVHAQSSRKARKIAILAALPEVQVLASVLLNSIGVSHELFLRAKPSTGRVDDAKQDAHLSSLTWVQCQLALALFSKPTGDQDASVQVVISSPETIGADHTGLGVESADIVVCLDEDWSGRDELMWKALVSRCQSQFRPPTLEPCRLVKLVAADTCEDKFLSPEKPSGHQDSGPWPWPLSVYGSFVFPDSPRSSNTAISEKWPSPDARADIFAFPCANILGWRGKDLSNVLATRRELAPVLGAAKLLFLPPGDDSATVDIDMNLTRILLNNEEECEVTGRSTAIPNLMSVLPPSAVDFSKDLIPAQNTGALLCCQHLQQFSKFFDTTGAPDVSAPQLSANGSIQVDDGPELVDHWQSVTPADKPSLIASSILLYDGPDGSPLPSARRVNAYSKSFSSARPEGVELHDGNQGSEALCYFPPVFPRMYESSLIASDEIASLQASLEQANSKKRKLDAEEAANSKRPRTELNAGPKEGPESNAAVPSVPPVLLGDKEITASPAKAEEEAERNDSASVLLDLAEDYGLAGIGAVPWLRDSALAAAQCFIDSAGSSTNRSGSGLEWLSRMAPCDAEEAESISRPDLTNVDLGLMLLFVERSRSNSYAAALLQRQRQVAGPWHGASSVPTSASALGGGNGVVYDMNGAFSGKKLKKKGPNQKDGLPSAFSRLPPVAGHPPHQAQRFPNTTDGYKRRLLSASRQIGTGNTLFEAPNFRFAASRVRNRVSERLSRYCWNSASAFETGPGLPLLISKQHPQPLTGYRDMEDADHRIWTGIVKRLKSKDGSTGDEAMELAMAQRASLRRSLNAPCRVDFGPFRCGFLSAPTGMTVVAPPRSKMGVSLPMGVKVPQTIKDANQIVWSSQQDDLLRQCTTHYGMNWPMVSRMLSGFQDIVIFSSQEHSSDRMFPRAARTVRDRWHTLARNQPGLTKEIRSMDRNEREHSLAQLQEMCPDADKGRRIPSVEAAEEKDEDAIVILVPSSGPVVAKGVKDGGEPSNAGSDSKPAAAATKDQKESAMDVETSDAVTKGSKDGDEPEAERKPPAKPKRSFSAISSASKLKQSIPITIPGIDASDTSTPTVAPSHPSHMQSVQTSVAAAWSNGRTEMWPLQLLDAADRHRVATAVQPPPVRASSASSRPGSSASASKNSSRQASKSASTHHQAGRSTSNSFPASATSNSKGHSSSSSSRPPAGWGPPGSSKPSSSTVQQNFAPPSKKGNGKSPPPKKDT